MPKIELAAQGAEHGPGRDPRTDHLRPVLEYLLAQGNPPAQWWHADGWRSDPGSELHYIFRGSTRVGTESIGRGNKALGLAVIFAPL